MQHLESFLRRQSIRLAIIQPIISLLPVLALALIAASCVLFLKQSNLLILPKLATFVLSLNRLNASLSSIAASYNKLADNNGRLTRLNNILSPVGKRFLKQGGLNFVRFNHKITFENIYHQYSDTDSHSLTNISFEIPKGSTLALVGRSGSGKTTIADLLTGLILPTSGCINIDGISLADYAISSWQRYLGVVSQDIFLFNDTIESNIRYGSPSASYDDFVLACDIALVSSFINELPKRYDTLVGERGYRLSGGQRQRISLARALLRKPDFLILDEATSALDSLSEKYVQDAIFNFSNKQMTLLIIAHRLSTIVNCTHIIVLDKGSIVEQGNHYDLLSRNGLYASLWSQQSHENRN